MNITQDADLIAAKTRLTNAKAAQAEIKLKVMQGEYVPLKEVEARQADEVSRVRTKMLAIPAKVARKLADQKLSAPEISRIIMEEIAEALSELSTGK